MTIRLSIAAVALVTSAGALATAPTDADRAFVAKVSQGGMYEVAAGKLAATRGSTQDVRDFAIAEVHDHMAVGAKLKAISAREGLTFPAAANADFTAKLRHLSGLHGAAFDAAYLGDMAALHDADGAAFAQEAHGGGSPAYRAFGAETHRVVQRHIGAIRAVSG